MYPKVQIALHTTLHAICPAAQARFTPAQCAPRSDAGDAQRPTGVEEALKVLAQRIRRFPEGEYPPLPHPQLLNQLTDELLVAASDGVKSVAAEAPSISGNSALRLLAWTVADARSATTVLEKPLTLTVGKRLDRQAGSVRAQLAGIRERAEEQRSRLRATVRGDALAQELAHAGAAEARELSAVHDEVYVRSFDCS